MSNTGIVCDTKKHIKKGVFRSIGVEVKTMAKYEAFYCTAKQTSRDHPHHLHYHINVSSLRNYTSVEPDEP